MTDAREKFDEFRERTEPIPDAELEEFWSTLEPVDRRFHDRRMEGRRASTTGIPW